MISAGAKVDLKPFDFDLYGGQVATPEFDYHQLDAASGAAVKATKAEESWTTVIAYARYKLESPMIHPFLKVSHDTGKVDGKDYFNFLRYSVGAEWFPTSEKYWLHAVYVGQQDKYLKVEDGGAVLQDENTLNVSKVLVGVGSSF